jgi:hypothetical protein
MTPTLPEPATLLPSHADDPDCRACACPQATTPALAAGDAVFL